MPCDFSFLFKALDIEATEQFMGAWVSGMGLSAMWRWTASVWRQSARRA